MNCRTEQIIVGAGNDYLLMLLSVILGRGHKVAMENPTYISAYRCFAKLGYAMCTIRWTKRACGRRSWKKAGRIWRTSCRRTSPDGHGHADEAADAAPCVGIEGKWAVSD